MKKTLPVLALLAALGGFGATTLNAGSAAAQAAAPAPATAPAQARHHHAMPGRHLEGRIAFLKAELKITPAQEADWGKVAQAMRDNTAEMRSTFEQARANRGQPQSAVSRLEARARFSTLRAQQSERFLAAFRPLYSSLSDDQKKAADHLLTSHHGHHHHRA